MLALRVVASTSECHLVDVNEHLPLYVSLLHTGKSEQAEALANYAISELQHVDIWVNNAGASQPTKGDIVDSDPAVMRVS